MEYYKQIKREFDAIKSENSNWNSIYQAVGEYIHSIKQNFETEPSNGDFLTDKIYDSSGIFAAHTSASALLGMLWPNTTKQAIEITAPDDVSLDMDTELADFYDRMTNRTVRAFDDPKANLNLSLDEYMLDQIVFGTSGVGVEEGYESKLLFKPYGVKETFISEGKNGRINKIFLHYEWDVERLVEEYGLDKVSEQVRKKYDNKKYSDKVKVLVAIRPRKAKKADKGKLAMPYESVHMEYNNCHLLREEGFNELPIKIARFRKLSYEKMGRSPAMNALPDIREANILKEAIIMATEKQLDPPLGVFNDGVLGGGFIDTSARSITVLNNSGTLGGGNPVFPLVTVGSLQDALARLEDLKQSIAQHFHIDKLLDFNNQNSMTFGEAQIRDSIRTASLSSLFSRQISELFSPLIERGVAILWRMGEYGVIRGSVEEQEVIERGEEPEYIPDKLVERLQKGQDIYQIIYKTKAVNSSRAEEYQAIIETMKLLGNGMQLDPSLKNRVDLHQAFKEISSIRGLPVGLIREDDEVQALNQQEAQQQQAMMALQAGEQVAGISKDMAQAEKLTKEAQ